jgi:regulatory protein
MATRRSGPAADADERAALAYLARRDRTEAQVAAFLARRGVPEARVADLLARWRRGGYLNDERYAQRRAEARLARRPEGRRRLEAELLAQGLDPAIVARTLDRLYAERSERALAEALLARARPPRGAAAALLRRQGFDEDVIEALAGLEEETT